MVADTCQIIRAGHRKMELELEDEKSIEEKSIEEKSIENYGIE
jgi:hypothetical protein